MIVPGYIDRFSNGKKTFSYRLVDWREQFHTRRRAGKYCLYICYAYIYVSVYCYFIIRTDSLHERTRFIISEWKEKKR